MVNTDDRRQKQVTVSIFVSLQFRDMQFAMLMLTNLLFSINVSSRQYYIKVRVAIIHCIL